MGVLRIASTLAAAAVAFSAYAAYRRRHAAGTRGRLLSAPEQLQRWEGEGGAVPTAQGAHPPAERTDPDLAH